MVPNTVVNQFLFNPVPEAHSIIIDITRRRKRIFRELADDLATDAASAMIGANGDPGSDDSSTIGFTTTLIWVSPTGWHRAASFHSRPSVDDRQALLAYGRRYGLPVSERLEETMRISGSAQRYLFFQPGYRPLVQSPLMTPTYTPDQMSIHLERNRKTLIRRRPKHEQLTINVAADGLSAQSMLNGDEVLAVQRPWAELVAVFEWQLYTMSDVVALPDIPKMTNSYNDNQTLQHAIEDAINQRISAV